MGGDRGGDDSGRGFGEWGDRQLDVHEEDQLGGEQLLFDRGPVFFLLSDMSRWYHR